MPEATDKTPLVIDNDVFSHWRNSHEYVKQALKDYFTYHKQYPALTVITAFEALRGFERDAGGEITTAQVDNFNRLQRLIGSLIVLPFDLRAAGIAAQVFRSLTAKQQKGLANDLFIASIALANGCGVATRNVRDFETIEAALPANLPPLYIARWK
ncbi:MAG TPA: type II toxin-antitoxin system VapC family toxin [Blastocatellia bacterium]|nr:type II toxin-antitoxin system VapC family toxin [Blastocatellia bacterium]